MKKLLGIVVLGLLVTFNVEAASYLFKDNLYTACNILTKKDPTTFQKIVFVKKKKITGWDRRKQKSSGWNKNAFKVFYWNATFETGRKIKIRVNTEFGTTQLAKIQALKYANIVGQLPNFLRKRIKSVTIHKGHVAWGGGTDIIIHTGFGMSRPFCIEEIMIHEAAHGSLDWVRGGSVKSSKWKKAAKADNKYISKYAKEFPKREDVAETINFWIAARCKSDTIPKSNYKKVLEAIPNRLKYFDEQNYDTYPLVCK